MSTDGWRLQVALHCGVLRIFRLMMLFCQGKLVKWLMRTYISDNLTVAVESHLKSASIWGILRGLETFAQLFYPSNNYNVRLKANYTRQ